MGQKVNCNPQKLASIVSYLQRTRTAHTIKDLEKHLPSVASINGMQVKDYVQSLQDDNKIRVEKIGSGNWYWSFASEDKNTRQQALDSAQGAHDKAAAVVQELRTKLAEAQAQRDDKAEMLGSGAESREDLFAAKTAREKEVKEFEKQVAAYSDTDPTEIERKKEATAACVKDATDATDDIDAMESWVKNHHGAETVGQLASILYGDELDEEGNMLKEI